MNRLLKPSARSIGLQLVIYLLGLWVGMFTGTIPVFALVAGVPFILLTIDYSVLQATLALVIALILTWISMDLLPFILISTGVVAGAALSWWFRLKRPLKESFLWSSGSAVLWLVIGNLVQVRSTGVGLLSATKEGLVQALDTMLQTMSEIGAYSAEQVNEFQAMMQQGIELFAGQWPYLVLAFVAVATITNLALVRVLRRQQLGYVDWLETRMSAWLTGIVLLSKAASYFVPTLFPAITANVWNIGSFLLLLSAMSLCFFYLRHWRISPIIRAVFLMYVLTSPWLWRVLFLVGAFDSLFNYRTYAGDSRASD